MLILNVVTNKGSSQVKTENIDKLQCNEAIKYVSLIKIKGSEKKEIVRYNAHSATGLVFVTNRTDNLFLHEDLFGIGLLNGETVTIKWYDSNGINIKSSRQPSSNFYTIIPTVPITNHTKSQC